MIRIFWLLLLACAHPGAMAGVFKCEGPGGKVAYQAAPCDGGREVRIVAAPASTASSTPARPIAAAASGAPAACVDREKINIDFSHMPVMATLQLLADFSGRRLDAGQGIGGSGAFRYVCTSWDVVLQDIASRHGLIARVEPGRIVVSKR